jgi:hypothetical protein
VEQPYEPPAPFAPPELRTAPLNEWYVLGRTSYPTSPMVPVPVPPPDRPAGQWLPGDGWVPAAHNTGSARRRTVAMVTALALALLVVIGALAFGNAGPDRRSLRLPESAGAYQRISVVSGDHIRSIFGSAGAFGTLPSAELDKAKIGIYSRGAQSSPSALFVGFSAGDSPTVAQQLRSQAADEVTRDVLTGAGAPATVQVAAGPLGGSLRCGTAHIDGLFASVGVWADADTLGMVLLFDPTLGQSASETGFVTRTFRAQAEH